MFPYRHEWAAVQLPDDVERLVEWQVRFEAPVRLLPCIVKKCGEVDCRETPEGLMCLEHWLAAPTCTKCGEPGSAVPIRKHGVVRKVMFCRDCYCGEYKKRYLDTEEDLLTLPKSPPLF